MTGSTIGDGGTSGNVVEGNFIGVDFAGATALANSRVGVVIQNGATANTIGGISAGAGNVIGGNSSDGVYVTDSGTSNNVIEGNIVGKNTSTTTGTISEFTVPTANTQPDVSAAGPDGNVWFSELNAHSIGRITACRPDHRIRDSGICL